jgi:MoaA/NifB/PqqE/SkfB family radical SAM enzyme
VDLALAVSPDNRKCVSAVEVAKRRGNLEAVALINSILAKIESECEFCGCSTKRLARCGRCQKVYYCSRECQAQDNKKHKSDCKAAASALAAAGAV